MDMELEGDSQEYEFLHEAAASLLGVPGISCELGVRMGGGTCAIIEGFLSAGDNRRIHIGIDPYGNIEYAEGQSMVRHDYSNSMKRKALAQIHAYCERKAFDFIFFNLEDTEFFQRYASGVPIYEDFKRIENQYALVHFDGPHSVPALIQEVSFFGPRSPLGARFIFDDHPMYDHEPIDRLVKSFGFSLVQEGVRKLGYRKDF